MFSVPSTLPFERQLTDIEMNNIRLFIYAAIKKYFAAASFDFHLTIENGSGVKMTLHAACELLLVIPSELKLHVVVNDKPCDIVLCFHVHEQISDDDVKQQSPNDLAWTIEVTERQVLETALQAVNQVICHWFNTILGYGSADGTMVWQVFDDEIRLYQADTTAMAYDNDMLEFASAKEEAIKNVKAQMTGVKERMVGDANITREKPFATLMAFSGQLAIITRKGGQLFMKCTEVLLAEAYQRVLLVGDPGAKPSVQPTQHSNFFVQATPDAGDFPEFSTDKNPLFKKSTLNLHLNDSFSPSLRFEDVGSDVGTNAFSSYPGCS